MATRLIATVTAALLLAGVPGRARGGDMLTTPSPVAVPRSVDELYAGFDPRREPLDLRVVRTWKEDGITLRYVTYAVGTFKGAPARMAAFYGFPSGGTNLPALLHLHGGGQRAFLNEVKRYAARGYACLSVNWGGRPMESMQPGDPNTDWGAVDPTQNNVGGYSSLLPGPGTLDPVESPRNNNWYLLALAGRRGLTVLERQPEVDAGRLGVYGHSMGGRLTGLVAGTDPRVKAAAPSVGGSGFLQTDLPGLPGSARAVRGDLALFRNTLAGQAYLARIQCPILFLGASNDFNAPMDFAVRGMGCVPHDRKRETYAPHLNHRFTPPHEVCRPLWFDAHLKGAFTFPAAPAAELLLDRTDGIPLFRVTPDASQPVERVDLYYGYERDPRNRFWADGHAARAGDAWEAACPVYDLDEPLFAYANVHYRLNTGREGDPDTFALSAFRCAYPPALKEAGVRATARRERMIDDFARGWHDGYTLNAENPHHWHFATRKPVDPRWAGPDGAALAIEVVTGAPGNILAVVAEVDTWRGYTGRPHRTFVARVPLPENGRQTAILNLADFRDLKESAQTLPAWTGITELGFRAADKVFPNEGLAPWKGPVPVFEQLRWEGGVGGGQRTEVGGRRSEVRGRRSEVRDRRSEQGQKTEDELGAVAAALPERSGGEPHRADAPRGLFLMLCRGVSA